MRAFLRVPLSTLIGGLSFHALDWSNEGISVARTASAAQHGPVSPLDELSWNPDTVLLRHEKIKDRRWSHIGGQFLQQKPLSLQEHSAHRQELGGSDKTNSNGDFQTPLPAEVADNLGLFQPEGYALSSGNTSSELAKAKAAPQPDNNESGSPRSTSSFQWDASVPGGGKVKEISRSQSSPGKLLESFQLDLQEKLALHRSSKSFYVKPAGIATSADTPMSLTEKLCSKVLLRVVKEPSATSVFISSVMARLGSAFNKLKAAGRIVLAKISKLFASRKGKESRAVKWMKKVASAAWNKMRAFLKRLLTAVIRFIPLILFIVSIFFTGLALASFLMAPNFLSLIAAISTAICLLSFIFENAMREHSRKLTQRALAENTETSQMELFGLTWAELKAEEATSGMDMFEADAPDAFANDKSENQNTYENFASDTLGRNAVPLADTRERFKAGKEHFDKVPQTDDEPKASKGENRESKTETLAERQRRETWEARRIMLEKITVDKVEVNFQKAKEKFKKAREGKGLKRAWKLAKSGLRLMVESLNHGFLLVMARFGQAWSWAVVRRWV